jgi:hypothetical protein
LGVGIAAPFMADVVEKPSTCHSFRARSPSTAD